jgi:hypothetical protein
MLRDLFADLLELLATRRHTLRRFKDDVEYRNIVCRRLATTWLLLRRLQPGPVQLAKRPLMAFRPVQRTVRPNKAS